MSLKLVKYSLFILIFVSILYPTSTNTGQMVEIPPDLNNWTFAYNAPEGRSDGIRNDVVEIRTIAITKLFNNISVTTPPAATVPTYENSEKHPCNRQCTTNSRPKICRYRFQIENYQTMSKACYDCPFDRKHCDLKHCISADGVKRPIIVVNRQLPGPSIEVCLGDTIEVEVQNALFDETTSIHWHGQHQKGTPFMDGVPKISQCPIQPGTTFVYRFNASVQGTHFWHSHSGFQRGDGVFGPLIVRLPLQEDHYSDLFDYDLSEHVMNIMDWSHMFGITKYVAHHHSDGDNKPTSILVNGKGRFQEFENEHGEVLFTPIETFRVEQGYRYRFRVINSGALNCPIEISVDNHTLVIISGDGADLDPVEAQSLITYAGERFDFIIHMNQEVDNYWIRYRGLMDCDERFNSVFQVAVLHYKEAAEGVDPSAELAYDIKPEGLQVNALNTPLNTTGSLIMSELRSLSARRKDPRLKPEADATFYISYDFYPKDNMHYHIPFYYGFNQSEKSQQVYTPQLNHITMKYPSFPLMTNLRDSNALDFCNASSIPQQCELAYCECIHLLRVPKNAVVELIIIDKGFTYDANHPFHLHGYNFRVIGMDRLGRNVTEEKIRELDGKGLLARNFQDAPIKDTVTVPDGGYTIIRWHATNLGYWLFHCHLEFHMEIGMALIFKVGEDPDYPPQPVNFPKCNSFYPTEETATEESISYKEYVKHGDNDVFFNEIGDKYVQTNVRASLSNSGSESEILLSEFILIVMIVFNISSSLSLNVNLF